MKTDTASVKARFDDRGVLWDRRDLEKLILSLLEERDRYKELAYGRYI